MDTKTPPIPLKPQERVFLPKKRTERVVADVSLPPLTPYPSNRPKNNGSPATSRDPSYPIQHRRRSPPCHHRDHRKRRPYRVLHIGATPLMHACQQGDRARVLKLLGEQEETIAYRDRTLRNALHYCMEAGTGGAVAAAAPELVNAPDAEGHTPLHLAVIAGDTQLVAVLLANGADVNAKDLEGHSVLHWATVCGEAECVRLMLAAGARPSTPDLRGGSPLHYAAQCCGAAATAELAVPKKVGLKVLQTFLEFGANVNAKDEDGRQPILWAASAGSVEAVLALARAGGSAAAGTSDKDGLTALHCAASRGHVRCVEALVNLCGSQPDHVDDNGCSALHYAATLGHADATSLILKLGADPNRQDRKGRTPALCAAAKGQLETLKILMQHGGSLHVRTVRGTGIGHEAVASGRIELIKWLAKRRPSTLDVATHDGKTPLHVAALHGHLDACKVLLDHGARINAVLRTSRGNAMTPLDAALYRGHRDCAKLIQMQGGITAQRLRLRNTAPNKVFTARVRVKHAGSSTASDSSPRAQDQGHPELYYEERWIERRTRRKGNLRKLARRDSRSFSEEEARLSKTCLRKDERRTRSESARYDASGINERNSRGKRNRGRSTRMRDRHEYSDTSDESSDSCDYSRDENETSVRAHRGRKRREENKDPNEAAEAADNSMRKEDDRGSVSDDSLEVIVVKKSLEKKCEKIVGRGSKTPRECTKETRLTKTHERSSKRVSRFGRSKISDSKEDAIYRTQSPDRKKGNTVDGNSTKADEAKYRGDGTDSTSQETVERVVVTAMVHKDQTPDTPESIVAATRETSLNDALRKRTVETDETLRNVDSIDGNVTVTGSRGNIAAPLEDGFQREMRQESRIDREIRHDETEPMMPIDQQDAQREGTNDDSSLRGRLDIATPNKDTLRKEQETAVNETFDESSHLDNDASESVCTSARVSASENKDSSKDQEEIDGKSIVLEDRKDPPQNYATAYENRTNVDVNEKNGRLSVSRVALEADEYLETVERETARLDNGESETSPSRRPRNDREDSSASKDNTEAPEIAETYAGAIDGASSFEAVKSEEEDNKTRDIEALTLATKRSIDGTDLDDPAHGKSADLSSAGSRTSMLNMKQNLSPGKSDEEGTKVEIAAKDFRYTDDGRSSSAKAEKKTEVTKPRRSTRPSTGKNARTHGRSAASGTISTTTRRDPFEDSVEPRTPRRSAIVAVIDSPEWDEDEEVEKEIREAFGEDTERETEHEEDNGVVRVLPSTSEEETSGTTLAAASRTSGIDSLPQVMRSIAGNRFVRIMDSERDNRERSWRKQRRDSGGRDSGIEPSPRVSKIPLRRNVDCCPNTARQQALKMETVTRDMQVSLRRYHLERKIFFQLMELKRLQIRHGRANEHVLVKRQVEAFHRSGMSGPILGVARYDRQLTFREFEAFLYEQLRRLQGRPTTSDYFCTEARQCTRKTHRCHHATSAYTSVPVYTYLGGGAPHQADRLPKIESRGRGQMTVEVTHGEEKQVIALPTEKLGRTKRYFVTFTVRGETQDIEKSDSSCTLTRRNAKSV